MFDLKVITGEYQSGEIVPSVRVLAKLYKVGTFTSHVILEKLANEGTLILEQGVGFRVNGQAVEKLKAEHKKRLTDILRQVCEYANKLQIDPTKITEEFGKK